jgi:hypothetical protein
MINAKVAQLVELQPSKLVVASSSLVFRSKTSNENLRFFYAIFFLEIKWIDPSKVGDYAEFIAFYWLARGIEASYRSSVYSPTALWKGGE